MPGGSLNHVREYRPLRGGIAVHNPRSGPDGGRYGTLGFVATTDGTDCWIVSCYHVLCRFQGQMPPGTSEEIYQPFFQIQSTPVAVITADRADQRLDCAAALVPSGQAIGEILGLGKLGAPTAPAIGMRVIKSGAETGVTEGRILKASQDEVEIGHLGLPSEYDLSEGGDSGALWVDAATYAPVALHYRGNDWGTPERAFARPIGLVLATLQVRIA